jgi:nucleoside-diphosphate-sugar epimerase
VLAAAAPVAMGQTVNLGTNREISVGDLAQLIARLAERPITIESDTARVRPEGSEVERLLADNTLARNLLGWNPKTSLEEGLLNTIEWVRQHTERYRPDVYVL